MNKKEEKKGSGPVASDEQNSANLFRNFIAQKNYCKGRETGKLPTL